MAEWIVVIIIGGVFLAIFLLTEWIYSKIQLKTELSRKFVHITSGLLTLLFPHLFKNHWSVLVLAMGFMLILYFSKKRQKLNSIHAVTRKTAGSYLFPVTVYGCFITYILTDNLLLFYLPMMVLTISDPLAAFAGQLFSKKRQQRKTMYGSGFFFITTFSICLLFLTNQALPYPTLLVVVSISTIATLVEYFSNNGWDNVTVPLAVIVLLFLCL